MVRDPLGIRCWFYGNEDKVYVYVDLETVYYGFNSNEVVVRSTGDDLDDSEQLLGPKTMVLWSEE